MKRRFLPFLLVLCAAAPAPKSPILNTNSAFHHPSQGFGTIRNPQSAIRDQKDFALFFAVDTYDNAASWRKLSNPVKDAREIARDLEDLYGFSTEVVANPTKKQVRDKLAEYARRAYPSDGQLLVYFTGHGQYIDLLKDGFFIPRDGKSSQDDAYGDTWLKYTDLRRTISGFNCPHILLAVDACFSGTMDEAVVYGHQGPEDDMDRPGENEAQRARRIQDLLRARTRLFLTSGEKNYVPDPSEFAAQFKTGLRGLGDADGLLDIHSLYHGYLKKASSKPLLRSFEQDQAGSTFLFDYRGSKTAPVSPPATPGADALARDRQAWQAAQNQNTLSAYREYKRQYPQGEFVPLADEAVARLDEDAAWAAAKAQNTEAGYRDFIARFPASAYKALAEGRLKGLAPAPKPAAPAEAVPDFMVRITGGSFEMGDQFGDGGSDEKPVHTVTLSDYYLGKTEVTVEDYLKFTEATKSHYPEWQEAGSTYNVKTGSDDHYKKLGTALTNGKNPVVGVSWLDAVAYCNWLSEQQRLTKAYTISGDQVTVNWAANGYRLPTEAEWEYAARSGGKKEKYAGFSNENDLYRYANFCDKNCGFSWKTEGQNDGYAFTSPAGSFQGNGLGLYDMSGNVWEWCWDWYGSDYYGKSGKANPRGPDSGSFRVVRGGSWNSDPAYARASRRVSDTPSNRYGSYGFRLSRTAVAGGG